MRDARGTPSEFAVEILIDNDSIAKADGSASRYNGP